MVLPSAVSFADLWDRIGDAPTWLVIAGVVGVLAAVAIVAGAVRRLWRRNPRAGLVAAGAATAGAAAVVVVAAILADKPADVSNPDAPFAAAEKPTVKLVPWPLYGFDPERTRYLPSARVKPPFRVAWRFNARKLVEYSPIVVDGTLYGINNNGTAFAINRENGRLKWRRDVATLNASAPAFLDGRLYVANLAPGQVQALNAANGRTIWLTPLPGRTESSPVIAGNKVLVGCECGILFALNRRTGRTIWSTEIGGEIKGAPALEGGIAYVGAYGGTVAAVRVADGSVKWRSGAQSAGLGQVGNFYATPTVAFGRVYVGNTDGRMYSFEKGSGALAWSHSTGDYVYSAAVAADTKTADPTIYFGSYDGTFYALDARSGGVRWTKPAGAAVSGAASVIGEVVYFANLRKTRTIGFDVKNGNRVFTFYDGAYNPVISDGELLYVTGKKWIYGLRPSKESPRKPKVFGRNLPPRHR